jgi:predicted MFS family arabinose efflux permease
MQKEQKEKLWNSNYVKINIANFMLFFSFYLLLPLLPLYLRDTFHAGKDMIGFVLSGYTITALMMRPFSGYLVDSFPRKNVLLICYFCFAIFFAGYFAAGTILLFAAVRTLHGIPFGAVTVSNSTVAIDVLPSSRRAEGIGYYGISNNLAMAMGPSASIYLYAFHPDYNYIFAAALITATIGFIVDTTVKVPARCTVKDKQPISFDRFFLTKGWMEAFNLIFISFSFGILSTYLAIYGKDEIGITSGTGGFFLMMAIGLITSRLFTNRSLRTGRITRNAKMGLTLSLLGYLMFVAIRQPFAYYGAALIIGLGNGSMAPAFNTMFVNLATNNQRGTANSTYLTAWDVGVGIGVLVGGVVAETFSYHSAFWAAFGVNAVGVIIFYLRTARHFNANKLR